jgi:hypothetical protein
LVLFIYIIEIQLIKAIVAAVTASATMGSSPTEAIAAARACLDVAPPAAPQRPDIALEAPRVAPCPCPRCGAPMIVIEMFAPGCEPRWRPPPSWFDTS